MLDVRLLLSLPRLSPPILTAYLDTNPANPRNQRRPPGYLIWLKSRARDIGARAPQAEQKIFRRQFERMEESLRNQRTSARGLALFAGPKTWEVIPLQVEVEDELHWGRPSLTQLLWILDEHQPCGVVLVDRSGARFFRFWLGEAEEVAEREFKLDTSRWRRKDLVPPSHPGIQKTRGSQRDVFEQRIEAQYARFFRDAAERIRQWAQRSRLDPVFVAGPSGVVEPVWAELPLDFHSRGAMVKADLGKLTAAELHARIDPQLERWKRQQELAKVNRMMAQSNGVRAVLGVDDTLNYLQEGAARELIVARRLGGRLRQCAKCGWTDRSADTVCRVCSGERRAVPLRAVLPELARRFHTPVEVVGGEAARRLREAGGIGALLR